MWGRQSCQAVLPASPLTSGLVDRALNHNVRVTLVSVRGRSGFSPFCAARQAAKSWAGTIYGIGVYNSCNFLGSRIDLVAASPISLFAASVMTTVSAFRLRSLSSICRMDGAVTPDG